MPGTLSKRLILITKPKNVLHGINDNISMLYQECSLEHEASTWPAKFSVNLVPDDGPD